MGERRSRRRRSTVALVVLSLLVATCHARSSRWEARSDLEPIRRRLERDALRTPDEILDAAAAGRAPRYGTEERGRRPAPSVAPVVLRSFGIDWPPPDGGHGP